MIVRNLGSHKKHSNKNNRQNKLLEDLFSRETNKPHIKIQENRNRVTSKNEKKYLNLGLDVVDGVAALDLEGDGLPS